MAIDRTLEPNALSCWLESESVLHGAARRQRPVRLQVDWADLLLRHASAQHLDAWGRVEDVAVDGGLTRPALFALAREEDWSALHLAVLAWGYGTFGNVTAASAVRAFARTDADRRTQFCEAAHRSTREAWFLWWTGDRRTALPGLRVAMGTKLLYFAGYPTPHPPKPLIYDKRVHATLRGLGYDLADPEGRNRLVRWSTEFAPYLVLCEDAARERDIEPDDVEWALFDAAG